MNTGTILNTCAQLWLTEFRASDPHRLNKGRGSKFHLGSQVRQETPEKGQRTYRPKSWGYNNKDEDSSLKTLNDKNYVF